MSFFRSIKKSYLCDQIMPVAVVPLTHLSRTAPVPLYPTELPFTPPEPAGSCAPAIVSMEIGEFPSDKVVKPGDILANLSGWLPPGYLICDGREVSRDTYSTLFHIIGTYYGDGDQVTTFNLPNLQNDANPNTMYIIKYDVWDHPYCPPTDCTGEPQPAPPQTIQLQILSYPIAFTPPPGTILQNTMVFLPFGYLWCDGAAISRTQYGVLFNMIGTYYGEGDGETTFNVPNLNNQCNSTLKYIVRYMVPDNLIVEITPNMNLSSMQLDGTAEINIT